MWKYLTSMDFFFEHIYGNLWKIYGKHGKSMENLWTICDIYGKYGTSMVDFFWKTWEIFGKHWKSMEHLWKIQRSMENMRKLYKNHMANTENLWNTYGKSMFFFFK